MNKLFKLAVAFLSTIGTVIQVNAVEPGPVFRDIQPKDEVSDFFEKQWANVLIVNDDDDKEKAG